MDFNLINQVDLTNYISDQQIQIQNSPNLYHHHHHSHLFACAHHQSHTLADLKLTLNSFNLFWMYDCDDLEVSSEDDIFTDDEEEFI